MTCAGGTTPRAFLPGRDCGGWAEERERRGVGVGESISAHIVLTSADTTSEIAAQTL